MTNKGIIYVQEELARLERHQRNTATDYRAKALCGSAEDKQDYIERADMCDWREVQLQLAYKELGNRRNPI